MSDNKKNVFWYSFANYIAILLGYLAVIFIFPSNLEFLGKINFIETIAFLISPFLLIGLPQSFVNFFPLLEHYHARVFYGVSIKIILTISFFGFLTLYLLNKFLFFQNYDYYLLGLILAVFISLIECIKSRAITIQKIAIPVLIEKILPKIFIPTIFIFLSYNYYQTSTLLIYYILSYLLILFLIFIYVSRFTTPNFNFKSEYLYERFSRKDFISFNFFSFVGSIGTILAFRIDTLIIPLLFDMKSNGIYSISMIFASIIAVPSTAIFAINSPKISKLIKKNQINELNKLYKSKARLLFFIGFIFLGCFLISAEDFRTYFLPNLENYQTVLVLLRILSINILINIGTGFNNEIITFSKHYRFNIYMILIMICLTFLLNYTFFYFTNLKLIGVALSSTISLILFNFSKLLFIYAKFKIIPFDKKYAILIIVLTLIVVFANYLPNLNNILYNIIYKSLFIITFSHICVRYLKLIRYRS